MRMSYKKGKARPVAFDNTKQAIVKGFFAVKLIQALDVETHMINIDESSFSRSMKVDYSWIK